MSICVTVYIHCIPVFHRVFANYNCTFNIWGYQFHHILLFIGGHIRTFCCWQFNGQRNGTLFSSAVLSVLVRLNNFPIFMCQHKHICAPFLPTPHSKIFSALPCAPFSVVFCWSVEKKHHLPQKCHGDFDELDNSDGKGVVEDR